MKEQLSSDEFLKLLSPILKEENGWHRVNKPDDLYPYLVWHIPENITNGAFLFIQSMAGNYIVIPLVDNRTGGTETCEYYNSRKNKSLRITIEQFLKMVNDSPDTLKSIFLEFLKLYHDRPV